MDALTRSGCNALHHACSLRTSDKKIKLDLIKFLIDEHEMDVNEHGKWGGGGDGALTPLMYALGTQSFFEDDFEILNYLLNRGADINAQLYFNNSGKKYIVKSSILTWAIDVSIPYYVIEWLRQNRAV